MRWLSGGLSDEQLAQWRQADVAPVPHYAFDKELPIRYDLQVDGQRYLEPIPPPAPMTIIHHFCWYETGPISKIGPV